MPNTKGKLYTIYALVDPRDYKIRYISAARLSQCGLRWCVLNPRRLSVSGAARLPQWVQSLKDQSLEPIIYIIEAAEDSSRRYFWIDQCLRSGCDLFNKAALVEMGSRRGMLTVCGLRGSIVTLKCACGKIIQIPRCQVAKWKSCGCSRNTAHGHARQVNGRKVSPEYRSWSGMKNRCTDPQSHSWHNYGGRGIRVCDRWLASFESFLADVGYRPKGHSLDRIDVNGYYEPGNVRWALPKEQARNRRKVSDLQADNDRLRIALEQALKGGDAYANENVL